MDCRRPLEPRLFPGSVRLAESQKRLVRLAGPASSQVVATLVARNVCSGPVRKVCAPTSAKVQNPCKVFGWPLQWPHRLQGITDLLTALYSMGETTVLDN